MSERNPIIAFALFPGVTQLDFTGPHQVFSALRGAEVILASSGGGTIEADGGMKFTGVRRARRYRGMRHRLRAGRARRHRQCDP
jgi:putative intracellular protease/amidase